ncbi:MAG: endolytic transglycosylase MltG [Candidatus Daviesbacteria bacterium]|nr:MAG: endolytic transglycosylase MltG [Candidatus Daviesbacteria bacterium]
MRKKIGPLILILLLVFFLAKGWWEGNLSPVSSENQVQSFIIAKGESLDSVSFRLEKDRLIKSATFFKIYLRTKGLTNKVQSGTFKLSPNMSATKIATTLTSKPDDSWVTLLEGWRVEEMAEKISDQELGNREEFTKQAKKYEGHLFPDTYLFPKEITTEGIIKTLRATFASRYSADLQAKIKKLGLSSEEGIILASIVEREARSDSAREMVASILLKRYKIDMGLNADATIQYILGYQPGEKSWWKRHLTKDDLKIASTYNTYLNVGLPPTPISNPSLSALVAVANANPQTPYLYYYHDSKGKSHYAKTLDEHNQNVANYP